MSTETDKQQFTPLKTDIYMCYKRQNIKIFPGFPKLDIPRQLGPGDSIEFSLFQGKEFQALNLFFQLQKLDGTVVEDPTDIINVVAVPKIFERGELTKQGNGFLVLSLDEFCPTRTVVVDEHKIQHRLLIFWGSPETVYFTVNMEKDPDPPKMIFDLCPEWICKEYYHDVNFVT